MRGSVAVVWELGTRRGNIHAHLDCLCDHYLSCGRARRLLGPPREGRRPRAVETRLTRYDTTLILQFSPRPGAFNRVGVSFWPRAAPVSPNKAVNQYMPAARDLYLTASHHFGPLRQFRAPSCSTWSDGPRAAGATPSIIPRQSRRHSQRRGGCRAAGDREATPDADGHHRPTRLRPLARCRTTDPLADSLPYSHRAGRP